MQHLMKFLLSFLLCQVCFENGFCQHQRIDIKAIKEWRHVGGAGLSSNGDFAWYGILDWKSKAVSIDIERTDLSWRLRISGISTAEFTQDSKYAIFPAGKDSLGILNLLSKEIKYTCFVRSYKINRSSDCSSFAYMPDTVGGTLVVDDFTDGATMRFNFINDYKFNDDGNMLIMKSTSEVNQRASEILFIYDLRRKTCDTIWTGTKAENLIFDKENKKVAFIISDTLDGRIQKSVWCSQIGIEKPIMVSSNIIDFDNPQLQLFDLSSFSSDGKRLFMHLIKKESALLATQGSQVNVWSYRDKKLQSQQLEELGPKTYWATIDISTGLLHRLEKDNELIEAPFLFDQSDEHNDEFIIVRHYSDDADQGELWWNPGISTLIYIESTIDGSRRLIKKLSNGPSCITPFYLSPTTKYVVYYDILKKSYFSFDITTGVIKEISKLHIANWISDDDILKGSISPWPIAGWLTGDTALLVYDGNDIWELDPAGRKREIDITNGYGRKHNITFRIGLRASISKTLGQGKELLLTAFNNDTKANGYYCSKLGIIQNPEKLTMGPFLYYLPDYFTGHPPIKAAGDSSWLVQRESANISRNYYFTRDFKTFVALSDVHWEQQYNGVKTKLISWKSLDGIILQGVLYLPANFNPRKKYPVIITYYEKWSYLLNRFDLPALSFDRINIPYFVSNGYIVFAPDIHYKIGHPGESAFNSIVSAAKYLQRFPWIDSRRMGLQGHSFGGYETNYVISHTHLFAAAMSASGVSDIISNYNFVWPENGGTNQDYYELDQGRMGIDFWNGKQLYIRNSPIYSADMISTPLLLMNNKDDGAVPFGQGLELFSALRRLGQKVWMLQYDNEAHSLLKDENREDYTIRMMQFFDHYLKGELPPVWMTKGIRASVKGTETGLEMDSANERKDE